MNGMKLHQTRWLVLITLCLVPLALARPAAADAEGATLEQADAAFSSRDWAEAARLYERVLDELEGAEHDRAAGRRGEALRRSDQGEEAIPLLRQAMDSSELPASERVGFGRQLARVHRAAGAYERALEVYRQVQGIDGIHRTVFADTALAAGDILVLELARYDEGIAMYERVERTSEILDDHGPGWARISDARGRIAYARALRDESSAFWLGPYTTHVHARTARVYWVSHEEHPTGTLELADGETFDATTRPLRHADAYMLQVVRLEDLEPRTRYEYTARTGGETETGSFRTAPPDGRPERIRFAVYGDTQDRPEFHEQTAPAIAADEPHFILHTGDMCGRGDYFPHWKAQFFDPATPAIREAALWPTVGNHDGRQFYDAFFLDGGEPYHSFTHGNLEFFILASYRGGSEGSSRREAQLDWLETALEESDAQWKFVVTHYPMISTGTAHWVNWGQNDFHPMLDAHDVDFVLTGHEHIYRRLMPIGSEGEHPIFHITSGGGASVGGDFGHDGEGQPYAPSPLTPVAARALHHLHFEIEGNELVMEARLRDGTVLDRLELVKSGGRYPPQVMEQAMDLDTALSKVRAYVALQGDTGRRAYRRAPATFEAAEADDAFTIRLEHTLPEGAGRVRIAPAEQTAWDFEPATFAEGEPIEFEVAAREAEAHVTPGDPPLDVRVALESEQRELVAERFRVVPAGD